MSTTGCFSTDSNQNFTDKKVIHNSLKTLPETQKVFRRKTQTQIQITVFLIGPQLADFSGSSSDIEELVSNNKKAPILLYIQYIQITCKKLHNLYITVSEFCVCFRPTVCEFCVCFRPTVCECSSALFASIHGIDRHFKLHVFHSPVSVETFQALCVRQWRVTFANSRVPMS